MSITNQTSGVWASACM